MTRALLAMLLTSCSWTFTSAPEPNKPCNASEASPIADAAIAVSLGLVTVLALQELSGPYPDDDAIVGAITSGLFGALYAASAVTGFDRIGKCRRHDKELYEEALRAPQPSATSVAPVIQRRDAWQLTKQAQLAARASDCETVYALDDVVRSLDGEFHRTVFSRDHAIIQCIAAREIPIEPPGATPPTAPPTP